VLATLIICTRNRAAALDLTMEALARVARPSGLELEVLVVDNGSRDGTESVVRRHCPFGSPTLYLSEPRPGKSTALNRGLAAARGEYVLFTDDDVRPANGWLDAIVGPLASGQADAVSGRVTLAPHLRRPWMRPIHEAWLAATDYLDAESPTTAVGANMAVRRAVLSRVPGYDPELGPGRLGLWEDTLFSLQLREAGFRLRSAPAAAVEHHFEPERLLRAGFLARARAEARSSAYVAWHWRHESPRRARTTIVRWYLHLAAKRLLRWRDWHSSEGIAEWELNLLTGIEFDRYFLRESKRPRRYAPRGLAPLAGLSPFA
jgi:glycosyltransferase involved in cell wall biosynthesis